MWRYSVLLLCVMAFLVSEPHDGRAAKRIALVIGNNAYTHLPANEQLKSAIHDAKSVRVALESLNFTVLYGQDLARDAFEDKLFDFMGRIEQGDTALFYFAGHGVGIGGGNYLLPSDIRPPQSTRRQEERRIIAKSIGEIEVLNGMKDAGAQVAIAVLDACRNNPLAAPNGRSVGTSRGFGRISPPQGVFSIYSAGFNQVALDRLPHETGAVNSVFTRVFVKNLVTPGLNLYELARATRRDVVTLAGTEGHDQVPAIYDQIVGDPVYLAGQKPGTGRLPAAPPIDSVEMAALKARLKAMEEELKRQKSKDETDVAVGVYPEKPQVSSERSYKPGEEFQDCHSCPKMVVLPSGSFMMGSPSHERERRDVEGPQHRVRIAKSFAVGKFEVTIAEWDACVSDKGCSQRPEDKGWGRGRRPVINVSWNDAETYVSWLSRKTGGTYRLLSEAEWEYAARAGTKTPFSTGHTITTAQANFDGKFDYYGNEVGRFRKRTVTVGSFPPNAFGLHDLHGNVWEWTQDCWNTSYSDPPSDGSPWTSGNCSRRVLRGGAWYDRPGFLRSAKRSSHSTDYRYHAIGFRVARTLTP